jgi:hypothetical protein
MSRRRHRGLGQLGGSTGAHFVVAEAHVRHLHKMHGREQCTSRFFEQLGFAKAHAQEAGEAGRELRLQLSELGSEAKSNCGCGMRMTDGTLSGGLGCGEMVVRRRRR